METRTQFYCRCHTHEIQVWYDSEYGGEFEISWWQMGQYNETWKERLRHIWHILRRGHPYSDWISLDPDDATKLAKFLLNPTDENA